MSSPVDLTDPRIVSALGHPLRARILAALDSEEASPKQLADTLGEPLGNVSYHVRRLVDLDLIRLVRTTPRRGALEHHYRARERRATAHADWAKLPASARRAAAATAAELLAPALATDAKAGSFDRSGAGLTHFELALDEQGFKDAADVIAKAGEDLKAIAKASAKRRKGGDGGDAVDARIVTALLEAGPAE